jgi:hypothetical protein
MRKAGIGLIVASALATAVMIAPATASAFPCDYGLAGGGNSGWEFVDQDGEFNDATLFGIDGPSADEGRDNAFDSYGMANIGGVQYVNDEVESCKRENKGREFAFPAKDVNGVVIVQPKLYVDKRKSFGRQLAVLTNPANSPVTFDFTWEGGGVGSGSSTTVATTSSGDISMNQGDRWGVSCDDPDGDGCGDTEGEFDRAPEIAHVFEGKGSKKHSADLVFDPELTDGALHFGFDDVTVGPNKTVTFMQIVVLGRSVKSARQAAKAIDKNAEKYGVFKGMSRSEKRKIQNW